MKVLNKVLILTFALVVSSASALANPPVPTAKDNGVAAKSDDCVQATARVDKGGSSGAASVDEVKQSDAGAAQSAPAPAKK